MGDTTFTLDDLSFGLDLAYTSILQQNQATTPKGEHTSRWLDENIMPSFSKENSNYFSMAATVLDELVVPPMMPSNSTSTVSTASSASTLSTELSSIINGNFVEQGQYQESNATTPATSSAVEYEFMNDQSMFPPLYDDNNLQNTTTPNSFTAAIDIAIMPIVPSSSYSQNIISPTLQFLNEDNPSSHQSMDIQASGGLVKNSQEQFSETPVYPGFFSADQTAWYQEQEQQTSIVNSTYPIYDKIRQERQAVNGQASTPISSSTESHKCSSLCATNSRKRKKSNLLSQCLAPEEAIKNHFFAYVSRIDTDTGDNTSTAIKVLQSISSNDNNSSIINSLALRRESRQRHEQQRRRRHHGHTNRHLFRSYNCPPSTVAPVPLTEKCSKTNNRCDICNNTFSRNRDVERHKRSAHNAFNRPYKCLVCGEDFTRNDSLLRHRRTRNHYVDNNIS